MNEGRQRNKTISVILLAFLLYLPFTFLGFGSECGYWDSYHVISTAKTLIQQHKYIPSRYPGSIVHELITTLLYMLGGNFLTNLGTLAVSLLFIFFFIKICKYHHIPHPYLLAVFMIIQPLYCVASTFTIDYLWALAFLFCGYALLIKKRYVLAGMFWALAIGSRMTSLLFIITLLLAYFLNKEPDRKKVLLSVCASVIIGAGFYIPSFVSAGHTLGFLTYGMGEWSFTGHLFRFVYKNIYFWGLQTSIAFFAFSFLIISGLKRSYQGRHRNVILISVLMIVVFEIMYFEVPVKKHYLLPILPFVLMLLGISLEKHRRLLIFLIIVQLSYNFININIARPDVANYAAGAKVGLWLEPGYLINDIIERNKTNRTGIPGNASFQPRGFRGQRYKAARKS